MLRSVNETASSLESDSRLSPDTAPPLHQHTLGQRHRHVAWSIGAIAFLAVVVDQVTKALIVAWIGPDQDTHRWEVAGRLFAFQYVENTGAAFGILAGRIWLLSILALVVAVGFLAAFWKELPFNGILRWSVGLILGGAIGNLVDRVRLGHVVDFIAVGDWPKFNIADSAITLGLMLMAITAFREDHNQEITQ